MVNGRCRYNPAPLGKLTRIVTKDIAKIQKISLPPNKITIKMREDIINLSNSGLAVEEIAEELCLDEGFVFSVLEGAGVL